MGYPDILILLGAYIRWVLSGFKTEKLKRYLEEDQDKLNFVVFLVFTISIIAILIFIKKIVLKIP